MSTIVQTRQGKVRGAVEGGVHAFKGIPYAAPPFGANRLRPPQPRQPWPDVRAAIDFGPKPPQPAYPPVIAPLLPPELGGQGEDCLLLNIWTPEVGVAGHPVMVWIPGGMFAYHGTGASPWYCGASFARDGVVCVTINYRVGIDGFLRLEDGGANRGLLDQIAALEWVQENITAFGGDPANVTVFGESAGAMSVATLLVMPRAEGLFTRAIAQSGAAHNVIAIDSARRVGQRLSERLGVPMTREAIAGVPLDRLLAAQTELEADLSARPDPEVWGEEVALSFLPWQPVADGEVIPGPAFERIAAGAGVAVDLIVGTNTDEHRLFLAGVGALDSVTPEALAAAAAARGLPLDSGLAAYRAAHPGAGAGDLLAALLTDAAWRLPAMRLADAHAANGGTTYFYEFAWRSPGLDGRLGACHALDIPFVFQTLGAGTDRLWGSDPPPGLAHTMHAAWAAFATTGDPGWPRYDVRRRSAMRFDATSAPVDDPFAATRALWAGIR